MTPSKNQAIHTALLGDWQNASSINKALLNDNPNDIEALNRLAFALTVLGKVKNARAIYKKVLELDALNPIALRNIKRLAGISSRKNTKNILMNGHVNTTFIEEPGKTKIIELVNIAPPKVIAELTTGQSLTISIKRFKIFIKDQALQYIGVLPDDIGKRLIKFIKGGNEYDAYVKSASDHHVVIFIKETKRASRFRDQPSFLQTTDKSLDLEKQSIKLKNYRDNNEQNNEEEKINVLDNEEES